MMSTVTLDPERLDLDMRLGLHYDEDNCPESSSDKIIVVHVVLL